MKTRRWPMAPLDGTVLDGFIRGAAILLAAAPSALAAPAQASCESAACRGELVYIGSRASGGGQGVVAARLDALTGRLTALGLKAEVERPTWLVASAKSPVLYAVSETGNDGKSEATVESFGVDPSTGALRKIDVVGSGGGGATHLALDEQSHVLFVANYGTGQVAALPVRPDGGLGPASSVQADQGTGPTPRQKGPHAHGLAVDPTHRYVLCADLGADRIFIYRYDPKSGALTLASSTPAPSGSGPRHVVFDPSGRFVYVNAELTAALLVYRWDPLEGLLSLVQTVSTDLKSPEGKRSSAELLASRDGKRLYVSNRGDDTVIVFDIDRGSGALTEIQRIASQGASPWSFSIDPSGHWLLIANEASASVDVLKIDPVTGKLKPTGQSLPAAHPSSVAFTP